MSLWQLRWFIKRNEDVKYNSWRERLHVPPWLFPSVKRTPRAAAMKRNSLSESSLTPIFFRTPRPKRTDHTTHTLAALAGGSITTIGNPHWQATVRGAQRLTSPKLAHLSGTQEATYSPPRFAALHHPALRRKPSYGSIGSTASRSTITSRSPAGRPIYGGPGLGIKGLRVNSSFEAATGIGMGSHYKVPSYLAVPPTPNSPVSLSSPNGRLLTPEPKLLEKGPAQIRPAQVATRRHRSGSIAASENSCDTVELDGEGRRMEKRARFERNAGSLDEKTRGGKTSERRQSEDVNPFRTPQLRVVNIP
jgi:hypothetical protein